MQPQKKIQIHIFGDQVSGKTPKYSDLTNSTIFKKLSQTQHKFYKVIQQLQIQDPSYSLQYFIPKYKGIVSLKLPKEKQIQASSPQKKKWIHHINSRQQEVNTQDFIILQNLLKDYQKSCIMDIKLGMKRQKKQSDKKFASSTTNSHRFRINGVSTYFKETNEEYFVSKYYGHKTTQSEIQTHLAFFFFNGKYIEIDLLYNCIQQTKELVLNLLKFQRGQFNSSSLFLCYDGKDIKKFNVKLIDFDKFTHREHSQPDNNIIIGLKNILQYLINIFRFPKKHQEILRNKQLKLFNQYQIIPKQKRQQFQQRKNQIQKKNQK